jgi:hypothetical protein
VTKFGNWFLRSQIIYPVKPYVQVWRVPGLQNTTNKAKDLARRTLLKSRRELKCSKMVAVPAPLVPPAVLLLNDSNIIDMEIVLETSIRK